MKKWQHLPCQRCHAKVVGQRLSADDNLFLDKVNFMVFFFSSSQALQVDCEGTYISFQALLLLPPRRCSVVVWNAQPS
jgi:hypothetical protein